MSGGPCAAASGPRRPAGPRFGSPSRGVAGRLARGAARLASGSRARAGRAAACLLAAALALTLAAGAAQAHDGTAGHVHFTSGAVNACTNCPDRPTGHAEPGPDHGQITLHWTPATTGPAVSSWSIGSRLGRSGSFTGSGNPALNARTLTITGLTPGASYDVQILGQGPNAGERGDISLAINVNAGTPMVTGVSIVSDPGPDDTYQMGDVIRVAVTFNGNVFYTETPHLVMHFHPTTAAQRNKNATIESGNGTRRLVFAYTVAAADNSAASGVGLPANGIALNGGVIRSQGTRVDATLTYAAVGHSTEHKVRGSTAQDTTAPTLSATNPAVVNGATLTLRINENLDLDSEPAPEAFTVMVNGARRAVTAVSIADATKNRVTLTLASAVHETDTVTVAYTKPAQNPLQDFRAGNDMATFAATAVTNNTPNTVPTVTSASVSGTRLVIVFSENLDPASVPAVGQFTVKGAGADQNPTNVAVDAMDRTRVILTLGRAAEPTDTVTLDYAKPAADANPLKDTTDLDVESFTGQPVANHTPGEFWSATLTAQPPVTGAWGCWNGFGGNVDCSAALTDDSFTRGGTSYRVTRITDGRDFEGVLRLTIQLNQAIPLDLDWTLHADDRMFRLADATLDQADARATWRLDTPLGWTTDQRVTLRLSTRPPPRTTTPRIPRLRFLSAVRTQRLDPGDEMSVTLPEATGGSGSGYTYTLNPPRPDDLPDGDWMSFDAGTRTLSGTVPEDLERGRWTFTWTVRDSAEATARLTFRVTVGMAPEEQRRAVKHTLAAVASRTVAGALSNIGARLGDAVPATSLTLAGESVPASGSGTAAALRDGPHGADPWAYRADRFGNGFGAPAGRSRSVGMAELFGASEFSVTLGAAPAGPSWRDARRDMRRRDARRNTGPAFARNETIAQNHPSDEPAGPGTIDPETEAMLDGRGSSDPEGDELRFSWTQVAGEPVTLRGADTATPSFTAPAAPGPLTFRLTVTDKGGLSASAEVTLRVRDLVPGFGGAAPEPLALIVGHEMDPVVLPAASGGNGTLTYSLTSVPAGLAGLDFDPATRRLSGKATAAGSYEFTLRAADVDGDAAELAVPVATSENRAPMARIVGQNRAPVARAEPTAPAKEARKTDARQPAPAPDARKPETRQPAPAPDVRKTEAQPSAAADAGRPVWSVWGRGDLGSFAGEPEPGMSYRGKTRTGWLGMDVRGPIRGSKGSRLWIAGVAVSQGVSTSDYSFEGGDEPEERGRLETEIRALWPYGRWTFENGLELRGMAGAGTGTLRHVPGGGDPEEKTKLTMRAVSVGLKRNLPPVAMIDLAVRGDVSFARMRTAKGDGEEERAIDGLSADSRRTRLGLEASRRFEMADDAAFTPFVEAAARRDSGDGLTGTGLELAGGARYAAPGIDIELRGRWLAAHTQKGTEERGVSLTVRAGPGAHGRGLSMSLQPHWGASAGGADALWRDELPKGAEGATAEAGRLEAEIGYGFGHFGGRVTGTPNAGFGLSDAARDYRIGWRLTSVDRDDRKFTVDLDATRREAANGDEPAGHGVMLRGDFRW